MTRNAKSAPRLHHAGEGRSWSDVDVQRRRVRVRQAKGLRGHDVPVLASVLA